MDLCITSGSKGGTGKTTFAEVMAYVWSVISGAPIRVAKPLGRSSSVVDFPAFQLTDRRYLERFLRCKHVVYVVDEDLETVRAVEILHAVARGEVLGVVLNKVLGKPGREFTRLYRRMGEVYVVHFDERLAIHRSVGVPPFKMRSIAVLEMAKAAVDIINKL